MSRIRANTITNQNANGAPNFPDGITVSGVVTATVSNSTLGTLAVTGNATVGGTLGVGGTITYEDVTNIDSVGIITARSGIRIGTGGTVGPSGAGIVTYFGDGSQLTGIDATQIATGNTKVQTVASRVDTKVDNVGILTVTAAGANVTGIITANSFVAGGTALGTFNEGSVYDLTVFTAGANVDTIASTTKRIEVFVLGMSITSNSEFKFQLRTGSGTVSSGYVGRGGYVSNASYANDQAYSDSWSTYGMGQSGVSWSGHMTIKNYNNHYWYMNADLWSDSSPTHYWIHGHVNAGALVTGFRFDKRGGNFDAGEFRLNQYSTP